MLPKWRSELRNLKFETCIQGGIAHALAAHMTYLRIHHTHSESPSSKSDIYNSCYILNAFQPKLILICLEFIHVNSNYRLEMNRAILYMYVL